MGYRELGEGSDRGCIMKGLVGCRVAYCFHTKIMGSP